MSLRVSIEIPLYARRVVDCHVHRELLLLGGVRRATARIPRGRASQACPPTSKEEQNPARTLPIFTAPRSSLRFIHSFPPPPDETMAVVSIFPSQYSTHPSKSRFFSTVLNPPFPLSDPSVSQYVLLTSSRSFCPALSGYSMWKTGFPASMNL